MSKSQKAIRAFASCTGPFSYREMIQALEGLGYEKVGKADGSRRRFFNRVIDDMIYLHEPHDGTVGPSMVRRLQEQLRAKNLI